MPDVVVGRDPAGGEVDSTLGERERLIDAVTRVVAERGFRGAEPDRVAHSSGLSTETFFRHFASVDHCLLTAYDRFVEELLLEVDEACAGSTDWAEQVRVGTRAAFELLAELEPLARVFAVDVARIGPAGLERRRGSVERAARRLKHGRLLHPAAAGLPDALERTLISGIVSNVTDYLLHEEREGLAEIRVEAVEILLGPYLGPDRARLAALA